MNGVHDMGGMHGFGPIEREENEPVFHAPWEGRVRSMVVLSRDRGYFNIDAVRFGIEQIKPDQYLHSTYFERWLASLDHNLVTGGFLTSDELDARTEQFLQNPDASMPEWPGPVLAAEAAKIAPATVMPDLVPRFAVGDSVVVANVHPRGHTRRPRYIRGKRGVIHMVHGPEIFADTNAENLGENPQIVYNVLFDGHELWGDSAEPNQTLSIDLWESYLEPVRR